MSLQITNINNIKESSSLIVNAKNSYDTALKELVNAVKSTELSWTGEDAYNFRQEVYNIIVKELYSISDEMNIEATYLKRLTYVLENAQEQVKNRLNS